MVLSVGFLLGAVMASNVTTETPKETKGKNSCFGFDTQCDFFLHLHGPISPTDYS